MTAETNQTPLPNGSANPIEEATEEATVAVRVGRLEHQVEKGFGELNTKIDKLSLSDADQTGQLATLEQRTKWREVAAKTVAGIVGAAVVTTQPEVRDALKAAWQIVSKLLGIAALVCLVSLSSGCAHTSKGLELFGEVLSSGERVAEKSCEFAKDPEQFAKCVDGVREKFSSAKLAYQTARTAEAALSYVCNNLELVPAEMRPALAKVCE